MLNTHKLLYILPDLAYIAELLPAKKEYTFSIQAFRQINGEFMDDNELIANSIEKLFSKLEKEEFHLILPDFLFTNTIVNVEGTTESAVLDHVEKALLPKLDLEKETHDIETTVLTSFKGSSKVQISAIEKSVLAPIRAAAQKAGITITAISPLSWVMKSIISLEPSISVIQVGSHLYAAQHYIGVDQASSYPMEEYDAIVETIKTLKGAEPSIQTIYLVSSALVEEDIKEKLSDTLPIQQLASFKEDDSKMPSYVKHIIESSMRSLAIPDFPVPKFSLGKATDADMEALAAAPAKSSTAKTDDDTEDTEESDLPEPTTQPKEEPKKTEDATEPSTKTEPATSDLPAPSTVAAGATAAAGVESAAMADTKTKIEPIETLEDSETTEKEEDKADVSDSSESKAEASKAETTAEKTEEKTETAKTEEEIPEIPVIDTKQKKEDESDVEPVTDIPSSKEEAKPETADTTKETDEVDLSQFAGKEDESDNGLAVESPQTKSSDPVAAPKSIDKPTKKVIKNSSGVNNMLKMVFITIAVFFITIAIGVGVGLGLLRVSDTQTADTTPEVVTETPTPTPTATPTPEPVVINKEDLSILVVNATTKAGYAGTIKSLLEDAEIEDVTAANAKGDYEAGADYILMTEENPDLEALLEEATELTLEYSSDIETEDPNEEYDAVIVLAD